MKTNFVEAEEKAACKPVSRKAGGGKTVTKAEVRENTQVG